MGIFGAGLAAVVRLVVLIAVIVLIGSGVLVLINGNVVQGIVQIIIGAFIGGAGGAVARKLGGEG